MYSNINGYTTKKDSLSRIVESVEPDIIALCETKKLGRLKEEELAEFDVVEKDLKPGQEGLLVAVRKCTSKSMKEVTETELKTVMTVRIEYPHVNLRVIVAHAPQETDKCETRIEFYEELSVQIERCITSGDELIITGDLNARIVCDDSGVSGGKDSPNGKLLSDLIQSHKLKVGNFDEKCVGKWTRIQACKNGTVSKSVLDYVLLSENMQSSLNEMMIDEDKIFCPYRVLAEKGVQITAQSWFSLKSKKEILARKMKKSEHGTSRVRRELNCTNWNPECHWILMLMQETLLKYMPHGLFLLKSCCQSVFDVELTNLKKCGCVKVAR